MPPAKQHTWAQAAGKGLSNVGNGSANSSNPDMESDQENSGNSATKTVKMEDTVKESQIAAAFSEGWGQRGVNQDTAWDSPSSPQCSPKEGSTWSSSTSTGTEIWENNVRHQNKNVGVKLPSQMNQQWSHTPTTHIGGTWGEEDEDDGHMWAPVPQQASGPSWSGENNASVWGANPAVEGKNWGAQSTPLNPSTWSGEPPASAGMKLPISAIQIGLAHLPIASETKSLDDNSSDNAPPPPWADPTHKQNCSFENWSPVTSGNKKQMRPTGWEETAPPPISGQSGGNYDDGTAVWGNPVHQGKVSHWKEMPPAKHVQNCVMPPGNLCQNVNPCAPHAGPGMIRLPQTGSNMNKNDTTWMKNQSLNRGLSWTDVPNHRDPANRRIWEDIHNHPLQDKNMPGTPNTPNSAFVNWGEQSHPMGAYWSNKSKGSNCSWADGQVDTSSWGGPMKQGGKPLSKDLIWASKQFRVLMEMNFKKDDIENALRRSNMNIDEALIELHSASNKDSSMLDMDGLNTMNINQPRMHHNAGDDINFPDHSMDNSIPPTNMYGANNFPNMTMFSSGFNVAQNCKNQNPVGNNIAPNGLGNAGTNSQVTNYNLNNGINNLSPAMMRKILQQTQSYNPVCLPQNTLNSQAGRMSQQTAQLRNLVQQIQMAVQTGHLNAQILNQPLAPQTFQLLFTLLHQIHYLQQLQQQQLYYSQHGNKPGSPPLQLSVQITQAKQHVVNLQNQIAAQQAIFLKQQQVQLPVQHPSLQTPQPSTYDAVKSNLDSINGLNSEFRDLSVKETASQSHSRLTQWKLPSFEKDDNPVEPSNRESASSSSEFSRAPGSITKSSSANSLASTTASHSASNLQPLSENSWPDMPRSQNDTWSEPNETLNIGPGNHDNSSMGPSNESGSGEISSNKQHNSASDSKNSPATSNPSTSSSSQSYNLNDLVPEFEPGKPWKGTSRIKNFEDDPHVTPGSIAKSPLSLNSIKDSELFPWSTKPNASNLSSASSLTSSTWTYSPPPTAALNSTISSSNSGNSRSWNSRPSEQEKIPWKGQTVTKMRRPPPGLTGVNKEISEHWFSGENNQTWSTNSGWEKQSSSNFLVLKNLTPQIDGSTLKTLCLQHGPLQLFHLLLNHGIALVRYSTREETEKARCALNNCVLSNTTILVDIPTELEVKQYLQLASGQMTSSVTWPSGSGTGSSEPGFNSGSNYPITGNSNASGNSSSKISSSSNNWNSTSLNLQSSNLWSYSGSGNSLWAMQSSSSDHDQCIPSSLNSFLPGDLLGGGESI